MHHIGIMQVGKTKTDVYRAHLFELCTIINNPLKISLKYKIWGLAVTH